VELRALVDAYAAAADDGDGDALAALFTPDGTFVAHQRGTDKVLRDLAGAEQLRTLVGGLAPFEQTQHLMATHHVTACDGERAQGVVEAEAHHLVDRGNGTEDLVMHLRYEDEYALTDAGWRFARRAMRIRWATWLPVEAEPLQV
jgi:uncharacterized protein (TIGR02246 family)